MNEERTEGRERKARRFSRKLAKGRQGLRPVEDEERKEDRATQVSSSRKQNLPPPPSDSPTVEFPAQSMYNNVKADLWTEEKGQRSNRQSLNLLSALPYCFLLSAKERIALISFFLFLKPRPRCCFLDASVRRLFPRDLILRERVTKPASPAPPVRWVR